MSIPKHSESASDGHRKRHEGHEDKKGGNRTFFVSIVNQLNCRN